MGLGVGVVVRRVWVGVCACVGGCVSVASAIVRRPVLPLYVEDGRCTDFLYYHFQVPGIFHGCLTFLPPVK